MSDISDRELQDEASKRAFDYMEELIKVKRDVKRDEATEMPSPEDITSPEMPPPEDITSTEMPSPEDITSPERIHETLRTIVEAAFSRGYQEGYAEALHRAGEDTI